MINQVNNKKNIAHASLLYPISKKPLFFPTHSAIMSLSKNNIVKKPTKDQYLSKTRSQFQIKTKGNSDKVISSSRVSQRSSRQSNEIKKSVSNYFQREQKRQIRIICTNHFLNLQVKGKKNMVVHKKQLNASESQRTTQQKSLNQGIQIVNSKPSSFERYGDKLNFNNYSQFLKTLSPQANNPKKDHSPKSYRQFSQLKKNKSFANSQVGKNNLISVKKLEEFYEDCLKDLQKSRQKIFINRRKSIEKIRESASSREKKNKTERQIDTKKNNKVLYINRLSKPNKPQKFQQMIQSQVLVNNTVIHKKLRLMSANSIMLNTKQVLPKKKNPTVIKKPIISRQKNTNNNSKVIPEKDIIQGWQTQKQEDF